MLRSANKVNVSAKSMQNYDGIIIAPQINFLGLTVACDTSIDKRIKEFFTTHGASICRAKINGEIFVKLSGVFNITVFEVEEFLKTNPDLIVEDLSESNEVKTYAKMKQTLRENINNCQNQPMPLQFTNGPQTLTFSRGLLNTNNSTFNSAIDTNLSGVVLSSDEQEKNVVCFAAGRALNITGTSFKIPKSNGPGEIQVGVLGGVHSIDTLMLSAKRNLEITDAMVDAANVLDINASPNGNIRVNLQKDIEWLNNPYQDDFNKHIRHETGAFKLIPSLR